MNTDESVVLLSRIWRSFLPRNFRLRSLAVESRMRLLSIAAASSNLPISPAMLITRQGGRLSYALAVA